MNREQKITLLVLAVVGSLALYIWGCPAITAAAFSFGILITMFVMWLLEE